MIELCCEFLSFCCIWLCILIMSHKRFRVNLHSVLAWMSNVKEFLAQKRRIQASIQCKFTLKCVRDMIRAYRQMHHKNKHSHCSSIIWPVWLNGCVFTYELSGCGFESCYCHWNFRYHACFKQGVPWYSVKYRV